MKGLFIIIIVAGLAFFIICKYNQEPASPIGPLQVKWDTAVSDPIDTLTQWVKHWDGKKWMQSPVRTKKYNGKIDSSDIVVWRNGAWEPIKKRKKA